MFKRLGKIDIRVKYDSMRLRRENTSVGVAMINNS